MSQTSSTLRACTPILRCTARDEDVNKIVGLGSGVDDYLVKLFTPRELVARVKAILQRDARHEPSDKNRLHLGDP